MLFILWSAVTRVGENVIPKRSADTAPSRRISLVLIPPPSGSGENATLSYFLTLLRTINLSQLFTAFTCVGVVLPSPGNGVRLVILIQRIVGRALDQLFEADFASASCSSPPRLRSLRLDLKPR